jgi:hypothetical protein
MVFCGTVVRSIRDIRHVGVDRKVWPAWGLSARTGNRLIQVDVRDQSVGACADIAHFYKRVGEDLPLNADAPLHGLRHLKIAVPRVRISRIQSSNVIDIRGDRRG